MNDLSDLDTWMKFVFLAFYILCGVGVWVVFK